MTQSPTIKLGYPDRSLFYKLANTLPYSKDISIDKIMNRNIKSVGFEDFGEPNFKSQAEFLMKNVIKDADLNNFGHFAIKNYINEIARNRLEIQKRINQEVFPELNNPIFILGLPRTCSTFLFNLMGATGDFRTLKNWETNRPASKLPIAIKKVEAFGLLKAQNLLTPNLKVIHEQRLEGPEECSKLLANSLVCQLFAGLFHIPEYNEFLDSADFSSTYDLYKKQLTILGDNGKNFLLKAPAHIQSVESLLKVFPNSKVIYLNRNYDEVLGSACSLAAAFRLLITDNLDGKKLGQQVDKFLKRDLGKTQAYFNDKQDKVLNIHFKDFADNPVDKIRDIYNFLNIEFSEETKEKLENEKLISVKDKFGKHIYNLDDYL